MADKLVSLLCTGVQRCQGAGGNLTVVGVFKIQVDTCRRTRPRADHNGQNPGIGTRGWELVTYSPGTACKNHPLCTDGTITRKSRKRRKRTNGKEEESRKKANRAVENFSAFGSEAGVLGLPLGVEGTVLCAWAWAWASLVLCGAPPIGARKRSWCRCEENKLSRAFRGKYQLRGEEEGEVV